MIDLISILDQFMQSPLLTILVSISIPLTVFFILFFKLLLPRLSRTKSMQQPTQSQQPVQQVQQVQRDQQLEDTLKNLINRMDKYQSELVNTISNSMEEFKQMIQNLNSSIEDAVLSLKSTQADLASPFNVVSSEQKSEGGKDLKAVAEIVGSTNVNLSSFIRNCVLLEVLEYDDAKITSLYNLGYISADDMYIIIKIQSYIRTNNGKIRAKDLASIAMNVAESYSSATAEMKKYLLVLEAGKNDQ
ncbi:MAG: hypothetical protein QXF46_09045 [Thermofilaceae archaeon]|nr:hypothetical protein [Candidatus Rehaiarchaeum fermentans]